MALQRKRLISVDLCVLILLVRFGTLGQIAIAYLHMAQCRLSELVVIVLATELLALISSNPYALVV
jgi:hypothetical protein